jgi:hypothetical protein
MIEGCRVEICDGEGMKLFTEGIRGWTNVKKRRFAMENCPPRTRRCGIEDFERTCRCGLCVAEDVLEKLIKWAAMVAVTAEREEKVTGQH